MNTALLIGAGFSRNWGGWLANEAFEYLLGVPSIQEDVELVQLLWRTRNEGGFEEALSEVQRSYQQDQRKFQKRLNTLQGAVSDMLRDMNKGLSNNNALEFQAHQSRMLKPVPGRFDAIFSLNQDLLLEYGYLNGDISLLPNSRWNSAHLPGLKRVTPVEPLTNAWADVVWAPMSPNEFRIEKRSQPIFKLHGSSNWRDQSGAQLLIIGGNKSTSIGSHKILEWYFERFREYLLRPNCRLMVIGYGFRDAHVNEVITEAVNASGLRLFVIDPLGGDLAASLNRTTASGMIYKRSDMEETFEKSLIGASRRLLSAIFDRDTVEYSKVMRFFG